jgi:hypothetical protein
MVQGRKANQNGRAAEGVIGDTLIRRGYRPIPQYLVGKSIFSTDLYVDFYLESVPPFPNGLIIESKWQEVSGSAEEKIVYLVENIRHCYPCPVIIIADGNGFRPGALHWLRSQAGQGRLFAVFSLVEFLSWCNRTL